MDLYVLIVLYNKKIDEIVSLSTFLKIQSKYDYVKVIIVDNSEGDCLLKNIEFNSNQPLDCIYISNGKNIGLSVAYNIGISKIKSLSNDYYVMLSDDDTFFSFEYLENVIEAIRDCNSHLYCGVVKSSSNCFSPKASVSLLNKKILTKCGLYTNIMAINSGIVFDNYIIDSVGLFDESFFVDMIDYYFCYKLKKNKLNSFIVLDGSIIQNFSGDITVVNNRVWNRYKIFKKDCIRLLKCFPELTVPVCILIVKRHIKLFIYSLKSK